MSTPLEKIVSGGQTGVDRGALDAAIALGLAHGGWCPRGRKAEDGPIPARYQLVETPSAAYRERTERNVLDSHGTLIVTRRTLGGGTALTRQLARQHGKPCLVVRLGLSVDLGQLDRWLDEHQIRTLNVAGPRESENPGIQRDAFELITALLSPPSLPALPLG